MVGCRRGKWKNGSGFLDLECLDRLVWKERSREWISTNINGMLKSLWWSIIGNKVRALTICEVYVVLWALGGSAQFLLGPKCFWE